MKRRLVGAGGALLLATAVLVPVGVPAWATPGDRDDVEQRQEDVRSGLEQSQSDLEHVNGELVAASQRLADLEGQLPAARQAVASSEAEAAAARQRDAELAAELAMAEAAVEAAGLQLDARTKEADETQKVVAGVAREVYQGSGFTQLSILVEAGSARDYADMVTFAGTARRSQEQALSRLRTQQADIRNAEARLAAERERVEGLKIAAAEQVVVTEAAEQRARDAQAQLQSLVEAQNAAVEQYAAAKAAEEAEIAELQAEDAALTAQLAAIAEAERKAEEERRRKEAERLAELERQRQAEIQRQREEAARNNRPAPPAPAPITAPEGPSRGDGYLSNAVNARISSEFGYRIHPILGYRKLHTGMDYAAACGTPIRAAADGRVVSAGWGGGYGNLVVISHGYVDGVSLATAYAHLSSFAVRGGSVSRGDVIGYIGTTGSSTGCHLHLETRENGTAVNPRNWL